MKLLKLVPDNTNIDFMKVRNIALLLSILVTVASLMLVGVKGLNLGVDFIGGQVVRTTFAQPVAIEDLRNRVEALDVRGVPYTAAGGTVTRTVSTRFGVLEGDDACQVEVRASWTALPGSAGLELGGHLLAWCDLLCSTAGLPPEGVVALHPRQG